MTIFSLFNKKHLYPKTILITGASSGIGKALSLAYAAPQINLCLIGRDADRLAETAAACREKGAHVTEAQINVTKKTALRKLIEDYDKEYHLDLVIANAGISAGTGQMGETEKQARQIFDVNMTGLQNTIFPAMDIFMKKGRGQIALMSSLAGFKGFPSAPAYSASKGFVKNYGEALRGYLRGYGVHLTVICPGFVKSRITDANDFYMPFLMEGEKAARIIQKGLLKNKPLIAFPRIMHFLVWVIGAMPSFLTDKALFLLPKKSSQA
ncbi:MAG: SDR family NAD(P)-dependent oxidoreductase [Alphaproteobacteria bacterium]